MQVEARQLGKQHQHQRLVEVGVLEEEEEVGEVRLAQHEAGVPAQEEQEVPVPRQPVQVHGAARRRHGVVAVRVLQIVLALRRELHLGGEVLLVGAAPVSSRVAGMYKLVISL